jgi:hypothetical protein
VAAGCSQAATPRGTVAAPGGLPPSVYGKLHALTRLPPAAIQLVQLLHPARYVT